MPTWRPDPTFYPSPRSAMQAPSETLAYVVRVNPTGDGRPDAITVVDVDPTSGSYGEIVGEVEMTHPGDELHHFGWNACSSMLCPNAPHPHVERRYLIVPGLPPPGCTLSTPNPTRAAPDRQDDRAGGVCRPHRLRQGHTVHCGPDGIYVSALGAPDGDGPGGIFILDHFTFDVIGRWEIDRGDQYLHYDFWWHLGYDTMVTSEWGTPNMVENGLQPELLLNGQYGHRLHFWDLRRRRHVQTLDLGEEHQIALELRPAHDPTKAYGFVNSVVRLTDLSTSILLWHRKANANGAEPGMCARSSRFPPSPRTRTSCRRPSNLQGRASAGDRHRPHVDDRFLYVSCWGTGELKQFDVSDPFHPARSARCASAASSAGHRIRERRGRSTADRRWSRSAATAGASTSPTPCTCPGTPSSTPTASRAGWSSSTPTRRGACASTRTSSSTSATSGRIRCGCRAATPRPTPIAIRNSRSSGQARRQLSWRLTGRYAATALTQEGDHDST